MKSLRHSPSATPAANGLRGYATAKGPIDLVCSFWRFPHSETLVLDKWDVDAQPMDAYQCARAIAAWQKLSEHDSPVLFVLPVRWYGFTKHTVTTPEQIAGELAEVA